MNNHQRESKSKPPKIHPGDPLGIYDKDGVELSMGDIIYHKHYGEQEYRIEEEDKKHWLAVSPRGDWLEIPKDNGMRMTLRKMPEEESELWLPVFERKR